MLRGTFNERVVSRSKRPFSMRKHDGIVLRVIIEQLHDNFVAKLLLRLRQKPETSCKFGATSLGLCKKLQQQNVRNATATAAALAVWWMENWWLSSYFACRRQWFFAFTNTNEVEDDVYDRHWWPLERLSSYRNRYLALSRTLLSCIILLANAICAFVVIVYLQLAANLDWKSFFFGPSICPMEALNGL